MSWLRKRELLGGLLGVALTVEIGERVESWADYVPEKFRGVKFKLAGSETEFSIMDVGAYAALKAANEIILWEVPMPRDDEDWRGEFQTWWRNLR